MNSNSWNCSSNSNSSWSSCSNNSSSNNSSNGTTTSIIITTATHTKPKVFPKSSALPILRRSDSPINWRGRRQRRSFQNFTIMQHFSDCDGNAIFRISSNNLSIWTNSYQNPTQFDLFQNSSKFWSLGCSENFLEKVGVHVLRVLSKITQQVGVQSLSLGSHSHVTLISRASHSHPTLLSLSTCDSSTVVQDFVHQP
jgi:hypothetical protein